MNTLRFSSKIQIRGVNPYIHVSHEQANKIKLNWKKSMPVLVQINGKPEKPWRINMMPIGDGGFYLYLHGDVRNVSNTKVGDMVTVDVCFDNEYKNGPQHPMPEWFRSALKKNPTAQKNWNSLVPSRKKEILRYFAQLKSQEAIERNRKRAIDILSGKSGRFMARSWKDGV